MVGGLDEKSLYISAFCLNSYYFMYVYTELIIASSYFLHLKIPQSYVQTCSYVGVIVDSLTFQIFLYLKRNMRSLILVM